MSKQCPVCKTINHSAANHCSKCGAKLPDKELSEEEKLHIELYEANITIKSLSRILAEVHKKNEALEEAQKKQVHNQETQNNEIYENRTKRLLRSEDNDSIKHFPKQSTKFGYHRATWKLPSLFIFMVSIIICIVLLSIQLKEKNLKIASLEKRATMISNTYPIIIKSLKFHGIYSFKHKSHEHDSLVCQMQYECIEKKQGSIRLKIKIYENESLIDRVGNSNLADGHTFDYNLDANKTTASLPIIQSMYDWYRYRYEIWFNNVCLFVKVIR